MQLLLLLLVTITALILTLSTIACVIMACADLVYDCVALSFISTSALQLLLL